MGGSSPVELAGVSKITGLLAIETLGFVLESVGRTVDIAWFSVTGISVVGDVVRGLIDDSSVVELVRRYSVEGRFHETTFFIELWVAVDKAPGLAVSLDSTLASSVTASGP